MKIILLMRHAKSSWDSKEEDDRKRPLSKRGSKTAERMGEFLKENKLIPDLVLASSAVRARKTAEIVMEAMKYSGDVCLLNKLYMAEMDFYAQKIQKIDDEYNTVLFFGHCPILDCLLQMLTARVEALSTGAVAHLAIPIDSWKDFRLEPNAELVNIWRPKDV